METPHRAFLSEAEVLAKLTAWGNGNPEIRAMILTSSLARPDGSADTLSDYDLILAVTDAERFGTDDAWVFDYGQPMTRWGDESALFGVTTYFRGVVYENYVKIDYSIWAEALLERIGQETDLLAELDAGYRVLLDKDNKTSGWKSPAYRAFIPAKPTEAEYIALIEEFWWSASYVAKGLWRNELIFVKWLLDSEIKTDILRRLIEWRFEIECDWSVRPGVLGRGLERRMPPDLWAEWKTAYTEAETEDSWAALSCSISLMRRVAREVGAALGYAYPQQTDAKMSAYLEVIRSLPPKNPSSPLS